MTEQKQEEKQETTKPLTLRQKLAYMQQQLNVPKAQRNDYGKYNFRSKEDILKHVKPLLEQHNCLMQLSDSLHTEEGWHYIQSIAEIQDLDGPEAIYSHAFAREPISQAGMSEAQITGSAASYAEKRALCNLFLIDDGEPDADALNDGTHPSTGIVGKCQTCGRSYLFESKEAFEKWIESAENPCCGTPDWRLE